MALDINTFNTGIYTKLNVAAITNLVTGIYHKKAPQGTAYPYVCYWIVTDISADTFKDWRDELLVQIDIFCQDKNKAGTPVSGSQHVGVIAQAVAGEMDEAILTVTPYTNVFCQRGMTRLLYEDDNDVWHKVMEYRVIMDKAK
ncbi:MAG: DUF3168 domain-containing protein [Desulfobacterales bacterium]|nr:DUF3168 domain-containing protein [Desulfobacterales bacterium]